MHTQDRPASRYIVAFTKDWDDVPTCTTHILQIMGKTIPVLWVSSIGTRKPEVRSLKDWKRVCSRVISGLGRSVWKEHQLRVMRPLLIPKAESRLAQWLNRRWFAVCLKRELPRGFKGVVEYWCFVPNAVDLLPVADDTQTRVIYYCADDWTQFHNLDGAWMDARERRLVARADRVFVSSRYLEHKLANDRTAGAKVMYMPHGVNHARFAAALHTGKPLPPELATLPHPVVGFYGNLHPWLDFQLIAHLAHARPDWSFVLIGEVYCNTAVLKTCPNVFLIGRREHTQLPDYCRGFDVAMIPYDMKHARMASVNPVKTKELLSAGVPVVASEIPELEGYGDAVIMCRDADAWLKALDTQCSISTEKRQEISKQMAAEDWSHKVEAIRCHLETVEKAQRP